MNSKTYTLPNGKKAVFEYDVCGIGKITLECMDELMGMIADRPQSDDWEKYSDRLWKIAYERGKASVRPQGEWIPCSEREPSEFVDVLVCLTDGTMDVVKLTDYISIDGEPKWCHSTNYTLGGAILNEDVLAWMPLPKPWKGADDEGHDI